MILSKNAFENTNCSYFAENLALKKSTWQLHSFDNVHSLGDRAVDGKRSNLTWAGGECSASAIGESTAEWRVDLGNVLSIHHIFIQYATNGQEWGEIFYRGLYISLGTNIYMIRRITFVHSTVILSAFCSTYCRALSYFWS